MKLGRMIALRSVPGAVETGSQSETKTIVAMACDPVAIAHGSASLAAQLSGLSFGPIEIPLDRNRIATQFNIRAS